MDIWDKCDLDCTSLAPQPKQSWDILCSDPSKRMKAASVLAPLARRLEWKVALITGGASGIGAITARLFARYGAKVVIADIQDDLGHSVCKDINADETISSFTHCDVTEETHIKDAIDTTMSMYGKLDVMFNNAGIGGTSGLQILNTDNEDFQRAFDVNVYGQFLGAKHAARVMIPEKKGSIIFTSSIASVINGETPHAYATSKHAVVGLMQNLCVELGQHGIRVNSVAPYGVASPMLTGALGVDQKTMEGIVYESENLKGALVKAEDVADAVVYLGSDEARYVSGMNLVVDGGYSITNPAFKMAVKSYMMSK